MGIHTNMGWVAALKYKGGDNDKRSRISHGQEHPVASNRNDQLRKSLVIRITGAP